MGRSGSSALSNRNGFPLPSGAIVCRHVSTSGCRAKLSGCTSTCPAGEDATGGRQKGAPGERRLPLCYVPVYLLLLPGGLLIMHRPVLLRHISFSEIENRSHMWDKLHGRIHGIESNGIVQKEAIGLVVRMPFHLAVRRPGRWGTPIRQGKST